MLCRSYLYAGDREEGVRQALAVAERALGERALGNPDVLLIRTGHFSVDDARRVQDFSNAASVRGNGKALIISTGRFFHEAQNALLKFFEEPPEDTMIVLVVPATGIILPTLRSRLLPLPEMEGQVKIEPANVFLAGNQAEREKIVETLLERAKSDNDEEKQQAREDVRLFVESLLRLLYARYTNTNDARIAAVLSDLDRFIPVLHERSAPLKPILEHALLALSGILLR